MFPTPAVPGGDQRPDELSAGLGHEQRAFRHEALDSVAPVGGHDVCAARGVTQGEHGIQVRGLRDTHVRVG